jgi:dienelactone hydrolase
LAASVAVYGQCYSPTRKFSYIQHDVVAPTLALLGELDDDGDPKECLPRLEKIKAAGAPVEWHVYPRTGHAWDQPNRVPGRQFPFNEPPYKVLFEYSADVTNQSRGRAFEFLARSMR